MRESVCYHEDPCTKNKHLFWILMHCFFFNLSKNPFYSVYTHKKIKWVRILLKESNLLGEAISCSWQQIPHPLRSLA